MEKDYIGIILCCLIFIFFLLGIWCNSFILTIRFLCTGVLIYIVAIIRANNLTW